MNQFQDTISPLFFALSTNYRISDWLFFISLVVISWSIKDPSNISFLDRSGSTTISDCLAQSYTHGENYEH